MSEFTTIEAAPAEVTPRHGGTLAAMGLLVRRRVGRDRWLVLGSALIVALATFLAIVGPEFVARIIDNGAGDAVTSAGPGADIAVTVPVGNSNHDNALSINGLPMEDLDTLGDTVFGNLPPNLASVVDGYETWVLSANNTLTWSATADAVAAQAEDGGELSKDARTGEFLQFGYSTDADVTLVAGSLPKDPPGPVVTVGDEEPVIPPTQVALSQEVADVFDLAIGDQLRVSTRGRESVILEVSGIIAAEDPTASVWEHFPEFAAPSVSEPGAATTVRRGTIMLSEASLAGITNSLRTPFPGHVLISVDADAMTLALAQSIAGELRGLPDDAKSLLPDTPGIDVDLTTELEDTLAAYPLRARAALAQLSIIIAGVVSVAAVVIALMSSLLLTRRENDIALERARGASIASTSLLLLAESALVTVVGLALGIGGALLVATGANVASGLLLIVALVALLGTPVIGSLRARSMWAGKREPANRQDRAKVHRARRARRLTLEVVALVVATVAVVSLRGRGVLQTATEGIDPFLAATPVLVALGVVVIVVRLYPVPMRGVQFFAKRTRGVAGVITLAKSREPIPALPLLGLTLAVAIAVSGGILVSTVHSGQEQASWERVGADVRIDSEVDDQQAAHLEDKGLTVSRGLAKLNGNVAFGGAYIPAVLIAMDANYPAILTMAGVPDVSTLEGMYDAAAGIAPGDPIPALASQELIDVDVHERSAAYIGRVYVPIDIIGTLGFTPEGWAGAEPYLVMPAEQLFATPFDEDVSMNIAFVSGPGAEAAVAAEPGIDQASVTSRESWLAATQDSALVGGVERAIAIAVIAVGLLAAAALLVTILRGVRERGRALSMLRTQGMGFRYGWWLALAELVPLTLAAVIGGAIGGFAIMWLLSDTLGLRLLSGGLGDPPLTINWTFVAILGGGILVLLLLAVAIEVLTHRRNKLSEVLRWGESR